MSEPLQAVPCPLCDYDLRGQHQMPEARCPECGSVFAWPDLIDPAKRLHPFVFEHHPRRNVRSVARTLLATVKPATFWRSLHPAQPSRPRRLVLYWLICCAPLAAALLVRYADDAVERYQLTSTQRTMMLALMPDHEAQALVRQYGSVQAYLDCYWPMPPSWAFFVSAFQGWKPFYGGGERGAAGWMTVTLAMLLALPLMIVGVMRLLRTTMQQARVGTAHLARVAIYCADVFTWLNVALLLGSLINAWVAHRSIARLPFGVPSRRVYL
jgi:hypothetical protein